jgi:predicted metalloprotease with PDZ domain
MTARPLLLLAFAISVCAQGPIRVRVDATEAPQRIFHVRMNIPAGAGPLTLMYPQWIPGDHSPDGPVVQMVGLFVSAAGETIPWRRDDVDMFAYHVTVPSGAASVEVRFDFLSLPESGGGEFSAGSSATSEMTVLNWNQFVLYPKGANPDTLQYQASVRLPVGWKYGTALPGPHESSGEIEFQPCSLTTLIDSPMSASRHYRTVDLGIADGRPHFLHIAADSDRALDMDAATETAYRNLVAETGALFGARHYRDYHFLLSLSDHIAHFGLEHHESSDDRTGERYLLDEAPRSVEAPLLPHEFVHSWNGKYRRPEGLTFDGHDGGYDHPMKGELLWVYEGLTEYLDQVLTPRSGLWKPEEFRDSLALYAAALDIESGRRWRPLEDTAVAAQLLYTAGEDYSDYRRGVDYYPEGILIWLEADVTIRRLSNGAHSLDDFCRSFYGPPSTSPEMKTYRFEDIVAVLNAIQPYDWATFFRERLDRTSTHAPLGGIENGGWKLTYDGTRSEFYKNNEEVRKMVDLSYSVGMLVKDDDGTVIDVIIGGPAQKAGISPSVKLIAVNGRQYTATVLREAVKATTAKPLELLIKNGEYYETHRIDYRGGERYPHLTRTDGQPDLLSKIIQPRAGK